MQAAGERRRREIIDLGLRHRGKHDEMLRGFSAGQQFRFDILMDIGGFRDMHRHRRCIQIMQGFTTQHGLRMLLDMEDAGVRGRFEATMRRMQAASRREIGVAWHARGGRELAVCDSSGVSQAGAVQDGLCRSGLYFRVADNASGPFSYRNVAYAMYEAVARKYPALAKYFRVHDVTAPVDLLQR